MFALPDIHTDEQGRRYLAFFNKTIAELIDRTPSTVAQSLRELEDAGLVEKKLIARNAPLSRLRQVTRRRGQAVIPHMNYQQYRTARRLVHGCCNYDCGNCLLLDNGEECVCPQSITYSLICKWFRAAVLPLDAGLCAALLHRDRMKPCAICGSYYVPKSNRAKYCPPVLLRPVGGKKRSVSGNSTTILRI